MGMNYEEARQRFGRDVRPRAGNVLLERNTYLERHVVDVPQGIRPYEGDFPTKAVTYAVRFHGLDVVTWWPNGTVVFRCERWKTSSTADRMRWASGYCAWKERNHLFVKAGDHPWRNDGYEAVEIAWGGIIFWCDQYKAGASETYADMQRQWQDQANERARERKAERREAAMRMFTRAPRNRFGWHEILAGHVRLTNGVLFAGKYPVAVCYPHPEEGVQAHVMTVSQRALKRTRVGLELVEQASAAGCKLVFASHEQVIEETQNRRHA